MLRSFSRSLGPVLYQPTTCSFAVQSRQRKYEYSNRWQYLYKNHELQIAQVKNNNTIYPTEHGEHWFMIVMVKKPDTWVPVILLKGHCMKHRKMLGKITKQIHIYGWTNSSFGMKTWDAVGISQMNQSQETAKVLEL